MFMCMCVWMLNEFDSSKGHAEGMMTWKEVEANKFQTYIGFSASMN